MLNVTLIGGPQDGLVVEMAYATEEIYFPVQDKDLYTFRLDCEFRRLLRSVYKLDPRTGIGYYRGDE